jgi:hypothetical protein
VATITEPISVEKAEDPPRVLVRLLEHIDSDLEDAKQWLTADHYDVSAGAITESDVGRWTLFADDVAWATERISEHAAAIRRCILIAYAEANNHYPPEARAADAREAAEHIREWARDEGGDDV